MFYEPLK